MDDRFAFKLIVSVWRHCATLYLLSAGRQEVSSDRTETWKCTKRVRNMLNGGEPRMPTNRTRNSGTLPGFGVRLMRAGDGIVDKA